MTPSDRLLSDRLPKPRDWIGLTMVPAWRQRDIFVREVSRLYGVSEKDILGRSRRQPIARARQHAMYLIRRHTDMSLPQIGRIFGRDHTTVAFAIQRIEALIQAGELEAAA